MENTENDNKAAGAPSVLNAGLWPSWPTATDSGEHKLDHFLNMTAESLRAGCQKKNFDFERHYKKASEIMLAMANDIEIAALEIRAHNERLESLCNGKKKCGFDKYPKTVCPECPRDYILFWPTPNAEITGSALLRSPG